MLHSGVVLVLWMCCLAGIYLSNGKQQVPCYFIFGDSLADPGNNNVFAQAAKANYPPYGIDFQGGQATGRFTNGQTYADFITHHLGFTEFIAPVNSNYGSKFVKGLNYASGSAGILDQTGYTYGERITLNQQLRLHASTVKNLSAWWKTSQSDAIMNRLTKCIYTIGVGSNDYANNYFMPQSYNSSSIYTPAQFAKLLIEAHRFVVKGLYKLGARKIALIGVGHIGFTPYELELQIQNATFINKAINLFNDELKSQVDILTKELKGTKIIFLDTVAVSYSLPRNVTFADIKPCCHIDFSRVTCQADDPYICSNRTQALFFDNIHPTESANKAIARRYYAAELPEDAYPYDIQTLAKQ